MKVEELIDRFEGTIPVRIYHPNGDIDKYEGSLIAYISLVKYFGKREVYRWYIAPGLKKNGKEYSSKLSKAELVIRLMHGLAVD